MSPRNDTILSLCLAQAELSPLNYRHGAIIVRGGKVIGQGFNTYRPGFETSNLKTGALAAGSLDRPALAELKERLKSKTKTKSKQENFQENQQDAGEISGSGHGSNTPLSMHSEMMAIHSALSLSSGTLSSQTSARAAKYLQKPCFSLSGDPKKRKALARGLKAYAEAVCADASPADGKAYSGELSVQHSCFEPGTSQPGVQGEQQRQRQGGGQRVSRGGEAVRVVEDGEQCRETPTEEERERVSVWVQIQRSLSSRVFVQTLST